jgi:pimeloyl-ACP methyl ester carboxylesterase
MATTIESFLAASTQERLHMAQDPKMAASLQGYFGQKAFEEYQQLATRITAKHLAITHPTNLIFIPGVTGSLLQSKTKGGIWWIDVRTRHHIEDLRLKPDGKTDADPNDVIVPCAVDTSYEPFLTAVLARDDFGHEVFPYDWRKPIATSTGALRELIVRTYEGNGHLPVHVVAHSMGGLILRSTLKEHGDLWSTIGKIVFVGTPHYGSQAMGGYLKNHFWGFELMALLGTYLSREAFRSMWGPLSLLPAPCGVYPGTRLHDPDPWPGAGSSYPHPCANFDLYNADRWQLGLSPPETQTLQTVLDAAASMHRDLDQWHQGLTQELRDRMLVIAGVGYKTLFRLEYDTQFFGLWQKTVKVTNRRPGERHRDGDGRVPVASALLKHLEARYVRGVHGGLTNIPAVYEDIFCWFNDEALKLPDIPEGALAQHLAPGADQSEAPSLDGTDRTVPFSDDPGLWDLVEPDAARLQRLQADLEAGHLPEFQHLHFL